MPELEFGVYIFAPNSHPVALGRSSTIEAARDMLNREASVAAGGGFRVRRAGKDAIVVTTHRHKYLWTATVEQVATREEVTWTHPPGSEDRKEVLISPT